MKVSFNINSKLKNIEIKPNEILLHTLRNNGYTEVKCGCNEGECGACLVLIDDKPINSCQVLSMSVQKRQIKTVKGIGTLHSPSQLQKIFVEAGADQCGYCSPGMIISAHSLLSQNPNPTRIEIQQALDGNLCRCTGYVKIINAVEKMAKLYSRKKL